MIKKEIGICLVDSCEGIVLEIVRDFAWYFNMGRVCSKFFFWGYFRRFILEILVNFDYFLKVLLGFINLWNYSRGGVRRGRFLECLEKWKEGGVDRELE